MNTVHQNNSLL